MDEDVIRDLFHPVGPVTIRRMFGGQGIYGRHGIVAVVLSDGGLFVKGDEISAPGYQARSMQRCEYQRPGSTKVTRMPYWRVPEELFDDPDSMEELALIADRTAMRAPQKTQRK